MLNEKGVSLRVDSHKRIGVTDVINMLKGLRSEAVIKIVQTYDPIGISETEHSINDEVKKDSKNCKYSFPSTSAVTGKTDLPQIRELNEIAALLRSMDS